jgi:hypothetical protein
MLIKSLFAQEVPGKSQTPGKSQRKKIHWNKVIFKFLFKGIEVIWMLSQVIQYVSEIFKK